MISDVDRKHLRRCVELAAEALSSGDEPFGSLLVSRDHTQPPEFAIARWAAEHMTPDERAVATVYTSGEHCPMCAAAHGWVGLGRIVYACSSKQLSTWLTELNVPASRVRPLPIGEVITGTAVDGPVEEFADDVHSLHVRFHRS
jgi:tRNA(Arg) A34 adenosine deaminase TadA